ncbi:MAG: DUF262 domain-containing protein [Bacteroidetes bacterium]|nr:DUF262 domain-containing protein [Bacteroidota bacterium]MBU1115015.1 DUF262 domain-containing protein [Bacteroidota bacterium]MBU1799507.1 DUF262 domain-containing protein [Bacteroidota bacterium]
MDKLELIPIENLLKKEFFIPAYQRGYRWNERQVIDLLEDILEFQEKEDKEKGEFYCLQPIVVTKKINDGWEVIDGQQRLTTLFILLSYLEEARKIMFNRVEKFVISYETREKEDYSSKEFLEKILETKEVNTKNIDFFHISKAYISIKKWFEYNNINKADYLNTLLKVDYRDAKDIANNVRFIWYEVQPKSENLSKNIFTRINMGKISLTNAELIKALFFINSSQTDKEREKYQQKLAYEWENIENTLQNKSFWFFLNKTYNSKPTKIAYIFDLIANKYRNEVTIKINKSIDKYYTFYIFNNLIKNNKKTKNELWEEIKTYFRTFEEWYNNNVYYHLIGYLIHIGEDVEQIKLLSNNISKSDFKKELIKLISLDIKRKFEKKRIESIIELSYEENSDLIREILLLFNVVSTMNSKYSKFPFERFIEEKWSLEHIHAQNSEDLKTDKQRRLLLEEQKIFFNNVKEENIEEKITNLLKVSNIELDSFVSLQEEIFQKYSENENVNIHSIDNMALLSTEDNSALNNNIFPIKRDKIIELDEKGSFIPICTKNVFLKYYSKDVSQNSEWTKKDKEAYRNEIETKLNEFLPNEEKTDED